MKISKNQMFRGKSKWLSVALAFFLYSGTFLIHAQEGETIFKAKCATCHQPHKDGTGPKLYEVRQKWENGGAKAGSLMQWVKNWQVAAANDAYAQTVSQWSPTAMSLFPDLTDEQITAVFDYVDAQPVPGAGAADAGAFAMTETSEQENNTGWIWYILAAVFVVIILSVGGVRRQLKMVNTNEEDRLSYSEELRQWAWVNKKYVGIGTLVIVLALIVTLFLQLYTIGVVTAYQPNQPIQFPHDIHAGKNGIDCKYCHNSVEKSKSAGIPTVNVCMNCHKQVQGNDDNQTAQISKIYAAAGFIPDGGGQYTGETANIVWNKVHALPDHVYFNHSQHVVVGGIDCKQCHGDMTKQNELPRVVPVEELNEIDGNIPLTRATLTMGWCIECHGAKEIANGPVLDKDRDEHKHGYYDEIHQRLMNNDKALYEKYLEDGKVTVKELGGWECAKCHY
ncbi:MAG: c-type cytochrome [Crocinitomicaceae bacterium]|nr:c-type cytochrome [Crocinitomicaceae bacterium]